MKNVTDRAETTEQEQYPTRLITNLYLVVGIAILIISSIIETDSLSRYLIGTLVEFVLAGLALVAMRIERLPIRRTARIRWPASEEIGLAVAAAPGLWIVGVLLNLVSMLVLGYVSPVPPSQFPTNLPQALALMLATLVAAPLCEELMFRGYVQRAYERRRVWVGVLTGGLLFALYHLRFQGVAAITPVALALSFIAWRTNSIVPGIALHAAYNAIATLLLVTTTWLPMEVTGALTGALVCLGILLTPFSFVALVLLWKRTAPPRHQPVHQPNALLRWAWIVPLVGLAGVYGYSAVTEVLVGRFPQVLFGDPLELTTPPDSWEDPAQWRYAIQNAIGDDLGSATCTRARQGSSFTLDCEAEYEGYDLTDRFPFLGELGYMEELGAGQDPTPPWWPAELPNLGAILRADAESWSLSAVWQSPDLTPQAVTVTRNRAGTGATKLRFDAASDPDEIEVTTPETTARVSLPSGPRLIAYEWAWRLATLPFEVAYGGDAAVVVIASDGSAQAYDAFVSVRGGEPVWTPAGSFVAWKVEVTWRDDDGREQKQTAWYDAEAPHPLIRYDDGTVNYILAPAEATSAPTARGLYAVLLRGRR